MPGEGDEGERQAGTARQAGSVEYPPVQAVGKKKGGDRFPQKGHGFQITERRRWKT